MGSGLIFRPRALEEEVDKYIQAERRLFELKYPGCDIRDYEGHEPRWCRDWSAAGPLMVEHGIRVSPASDFVTAKHDIYGDFLVVECSDHPDRDTAVRYAIVQAVIAKLEANNV